MILAQQSSPDKSSKISDHLEKAAETLEIALSRLNKSDKEVLYVCTILLLKHVQCFFFTILYSYVKRLKRSRLKSSNCFQRSSVV